MRNFSLNLPLKERGTIPVHFPGEGVGREGKDESLFIYDIYGIILLINGGDIYEIYILYADKTIFWQGYA